MSFDRKVLIIALFTFLISFSQAVYAQNFGSGYYRLTSNWLGENKSLDVLNDGANNNSPLEFKQIYLQGFKINFDKNIEEREDIRAALDALDEDLEQIAGIVKENHLTLFKQVPIWIEIKRQDRASAVYLKNATKDWMAANGYPPESLKSIEIRNVKNYVAWRNLNQPLLILHEMSHAYHDLHLSEELKEEITAAYNNAVKSKKYENVAHSEGGTKRAYALTTEDEYFAELTEAYFGENDFYPFNRQDLEEFDPEGYELMQMVWD